MSANKSVRQKRLKEKKQQHYIGAELDIVIIQDNKNW